LRNEKEVWLIARRKGVLPASGYSAGNEEILELAFSNKGKIVNSFVKFATPI
jgi:hypothetical protein